MKQDRIVYLGVVVRRDKDGQFLRDVELGPFNDRRYAESKAKDSARDRDDWMVDSLVQQWSEEDQMWLTSEAVTLSGTM